VQALALIPSERRPVLVLPGYETPHELDLRAQAAQLGVEEDVRVVGWVAAEELEGLYRSAVCSVFPSLYEGFGLPVLEAMARGLPVACSDRGALREVAGDAALTFDPTSARSIAGAIETLLRDVAERERLSLLGRERASRFSWAETARGTLASYERALEPA
jgi:glycosyltransferase involved in cell wall biosynthesis